VPEQSVSKYEARTAPLIHPKATVLASSEKMIAGRVLVHEIYSMVVALGGIRVSAATRGPRLVSYAVRLITA
jgi:hypothetical protein